MLPTSSQKGLFRVGHERPLNTNSCEILINALIRYRIIDLFTKHGHLFNPLATPFAIFNGWYAALRPIRRRKRLRDMACGSNM